MRKKIENALFELGITPDLTGFGYIVEFVWTVSSSTSKIPTTTVYEMVAERKQTTASRVERGIRHAFTKVDVNSEAFNKYIGIKQKTNSALLYALAYRLREGETNESGN